MYNNYTVLKSPTTKKFSCDIAICPEDGLACLSYLEGEGQETMRASYLQAVMPFMLQRECQLCNSKFPSFLKYTAAPTAVVREKSFRLT